MNLISTQLDYSGLFDYFDFQYFLNDMLFVAKAGKTDFMTILKRNEMDDIKNMLDLVQEHMKSIMNEHLDSFLKPKNMIKLESLEGLDSKKIQNVYKTWKIWKFKKHYLAGIIPN